MKLRFLLAAILAAPFLSPRAHADEDGDEEAAAIAHRYGIEDFNRLDALKFTFNIRETTTTVSRAWTWSLSSGKVALVSRVGGKPFTHAVNLQAAPGSPQDRRVTAWFESDRQWLLLPLEIVNDRNVDITIDEEQPLPIPPGNADCLIVDPVETATGPHADAHEIYYDAERIILQSVLRRGGSPTPALVLTWSDLARMGPILVSLRRKSADGRTEIWFSDVEVKLKGGQDWVRAKPGR